MLQTKKQLTPILMVMTRFDPEFNEVVQWSLHTIPEDFVQIGPAITEKLSPSQFEGMTLTL